MRTMIQKRNITAKNNSSIFSTKKLMSGISLQLYKLYRFHSFEQNSWIMDVPVANSQIHFQ